MPGPPPQPFLVALLHDSLVCVPVSLWRCWQANWFNSSGDRHGSHVLVPWNLECGGCRDFPFDIWIMFSSCAPTAPCWHPLGAQLSPNMLVTPLLATAVLTYGPSKKFFLAAPWPAARPLSQAPPRGRRGPEGASRGVASPGAVPKGWGGGWYGWDNPGTPPQYLFRKLARQLSHLLLRHRPVA